MVVYVDQLNFESSERYEREMKEHNAWLLSSKSRDTGENSEQSHEPEPAKMETPDGNTQNISIPEHFSPAYPRSSFPDQFHFATPCFFTNCPEN